MATLPAPVRPRIAACNGSFIRRFRGAEHGGEKGTPERPFASLRMYFPLEGSPTVMLGARIVRAAIDHLGVEFSSGQEDKVHGLIDELIKSL